MAQSNTQSPLVQSYVPDENRITYFAETDSRNRRVNFGIKARDRTRHVYVIGKTGMGKSTLLENFAVQDIKNGEGLAFIDPHGKSADFLLDYIPKERLNDVLYFAPFDMDYPISFNVMEDVGADKRHLVVSGLMSAFKKIWVDAWSARMEYILSNSLLALLEYPGSTLLGINRMLSDKTYRKKVVDNIKDPSVKSFWVDEFAKYTDRFAAEATPAIQNKVGQFTSNPLIRNIIGQPHSTFDFRKMMDERKIIVVNLSKGRVGESNANLLGSMLITKMYLAAMSRADTPEAALKKLPNFYLYVDEFQSFANESFADILSEARKYKLNLTIAHQYIEQMSEEVRAAVFGNVGTMISFRVGAFDAEVLEKEFAPQFAAEDMVNLGFAQIYLKLMIDGVSSPPFSATTLPPVPKPAVTHKEDIIKSSREMFSRPRAIVETEIRDWHEPEKHPEKTAAKEPLREPVKEFRRRETPETRGGGHEAPHKQRENTPLNESQGKFKSDLKDLLKKIGQPDVSQEHLSPNPPPRTSVESVGPGALPLTSPVTELKKSPQTALPATPVAALRNDNKVPTTENLAGLRAALTAALQPKNTSVGAAEAQKMPSDHEQRPMAPKESAQNTSHALSGKVLERDQRRPSPDKSETARTQPFSAKQQVSSSSSVEHKPPFPTEPNPGSSKPKREVPHESVRKIFEPD